MPSRHTSSTFQAPVGIDNFFDLVDPQRHGLYVDRTLWISQIYAEQSQVLAFHTFRRSGKSLTASMLAHFFAPQVGLTKTQGMFDALELGQKDPAFVAEHQGQYPVIALTLKNAQGETFESSANSLCRLVKSAYLKHLYLKESSVLSEEEKDRFSFYASAAEDATFPLDVWQNSFLELTILLEKHHNKRVIVIIDEYDAPMVGGAKHGYLPQITYFMREILGSALKSNDALQKAVLFGIIRFSKESFLSGLNNVQVYTLLNPGEYTPYFGFTEKEVRHLLQQAHIPTDYLQKIKEAYNGYLVGNIPMYNPLSVMAHIKSGRREPTTQWVNTGSDELQRRALLKASNETKDKFRALIGGQESVFVQINDMIRFEDIDTDEDALWALLYGAGYLTAAEPLQPMGTHYEGQVKIPNHEIKSLYVEVLVSWLSKEAFKRPTSLLTPFYDALRQGKAEKLGQWLGDFLLTRTSHHNFTDEASYHTLLLGLTAGLLDSHHVWSEPEAGHGRADLMLVPRTGSENDLAWVFEFKRLPKQKKVLNDEEEEILLEDLASEGLAQITQNQYHAKLVDFPHVKRVLKMGIAFGGKSVRWKSEVVG